MSVNLIQDVDVLGSKFLLQYPVDPTLFHETGFLFGNNKKINISTLFRIIHA